MKIVRSKGRNSGYYVEERDFDLAELKLLVDAVQSSKFITKEKSDELIKKLGSLTNTANADELQRNVFIRNRIKTENSEIYTSVDAIHAAIRDNHQIRFKYCRRNIENCQLAHRMCNSVKNDVEGGFLIDWEAMLSEKPGRWDSQFDDLWDQLDKEEGKNDMAV